ncbi:uncharacterized protein LOC117525830 [Thalassophryne amazonica]|uniref:uncharacterized protein LOC117525830 n=1 Tax=Thalassophryne amazonica TaxID=390379 RepID=UPI00147258F5|nr:uncharacterized protein LOC117525830 [Thalassophryne amazonica]
MCEVTTELFKEVMKEDSSSESLPAPLLLMLSPPPPFLTFPGEPTMLWNKWLQCFEDYLAELDENKMLNSNKCVLLRKCLGQEGQRIYSTLIQCETTYGAAVSALTVYFNSQMHLLKFQERSQRPGETVEQFVSALEELAKPCNYGDLKDKLILNQLFEKTSCRQLRERLLLEKESLTLTTALVIGKEIGSCLKEPGLHDTCEEKIEEDLDTNAVRKHVENGTQSNSSTYQDYISAHTLCYSDYVSEQDESVLEGDKVLDKGNSNWTSCMLEEGNCGKVNDYDNELSVSDMQEGHICSICFKSFIKANKLARHMRTHTKEKPFSCPICSTTFSQSYHMTRHLRNQHGASQYVCPKCGESFGNHPELQFHKRIHNSQVPSCPDCDEVFQDSDMFFKHIKLHSEDVTNQSEAHSSQQDCGLIIQQNEKLCNMDDDVTNGNVGGEDEQVDADSGHDDTSNGELDSITVEDEDSDGSVTERTLTSRNKKMGYFCPICEDRRFTVPYKLARHMRMHTNEKPFSCPVCAMAFSQSYHMTRHLRNQHDMGDHICSNCGKGFSTLLELKAHKKTHAAKGLSCPVCNRHFKERTLLDSHIKSHYSLQSDSRCLTCTDCGKTFRRMYHLKKHILTHRRSAYGTCFECCHCPKNFSLPEELRKHIKTHVMESSGICPKCSQSFSSPEELQTHMEVHEKSHVCTTCSKSFKLEYALKKHEEIHKEGQFYCSLCNKQFMHCSNYKNHIISHQKKESKCPHCDRIFLTLTAFKCHLQTHTEERPYKCPCCIETFEKKEDLDLHCLKHRKFKKARPYSCTRCDYAFATLPDLTEHMNSHEGELPQNCPCCPKTFLNKSKLEKHLSIHTGERPHLCSLCGNGFVNAASLKIHLRVHTGEKPFPCSKCSKSFRTSSGLRLHSTQHMAVQPRYQCPDCSKSYGRMTELKKHQRYHTGDKPYSCNCCNKRFISKDKVIVHMRVHTGERPYSCPHCGQMFKQFGDRNRHVNKCHYHSWLKWRKSNSSLCLTMCEVTMEVDKEMAKQGSSMESYPEPVLIILSPPPPFLPFSGEMAMSWNKWLESFEHYLGALGENNLPDPSKCVLLQNCLGQEGQNVYSTLIPGDTTYAAAVSQLTVYFNSQMHLLRFQKRSQRPGETVEQFVSALEELSKPCNYGDLKDKLILNHLIEKTNCRQLRDRLSLEKDSLTLAKALVIGKEMETHFKTEPELLDIHEVCVDFGDNLDLPVPRVAKRGRPRRGESGATQKRSTGTQFIGKKMRSGLNESDMFDIHEVSVEIGDGLDPPVPRVAKRGRPRRSERGPKQKHIARTQVTGKVRSALNESEMLSTHEVSVEIGDSLEPSVPRVVKKRGRPRRGESRATQKCSTTTKVANVENGERLGAPVPRVAKKRGRPRREESLAKQNSLTTNRIINKVESGSLGTHEVSGQTNIGLSVPRVAKRGRPRRGESKIDRQQLLARTEITDRNMESALNETEVINFHGESLELGDNLKATVPRVAKRGRPRREERDVQQETRSSRIPFSSSRHSDDYYYSNDKLYYSDDQTAESSDESSVECSNADDERNCDSATTSLKMKEEILGTDDEDDDEKQYLSSPTKYKGPFCPICINKRFRDKNKLARHMRTHTKEKPFMCPICSACFSQSYHMTRHLRNQHGADQYVCSKCGESFESHSDLQSHKRTHIQRFLSCSVCDEKFIDNDIFVNHVKSHNKEQTDQIEAQSSHQCDGATIKEKEPSSNADNNHADSCSNGVEDAQANSDSGKDDAHDKDSEASVEDKNGDDCVQDKVGSNANSKGHFCPICVGRRFRGPNKLARHMRMHTKEKPFTCPVCAANFSQSYHMNRHLRNQHGMAEYICSKCGQSFGTWMELKVHKKMHGVKGLLCPTCDKEFKEMSELDSHIASHFKANSPSLICSDCGKKFGRMYHLKRHVLTHSKSAGDAAYKCPHCAKTFANSRDLAKHMDIHEKVNNGICPKCGLTFSLIEELQTHMESHEKSYPCPTCGKVFKVEYALKKHEQVHKEGLFYCSLCHKQFAKLSHYKRHVSAHERRESRCPHCDTVFLKLTAFKYHLRTHTQERPHQCTCCIESFEKEEDLDQHCLKHRKFKKERPYSCTRCDNAFATLVELTEHMSSHEGEPPIDCPVCARSFLNKNKLEKHLSIHTGERPHLCSICGNGFSCAASLKIHARVHTGEKPFQCSECSKSFRTPSGLRLHSRQHMAVQPRFQCPECGRSYGRMTELRMHQRYHTGDKPYSCTCCNKSFISKDKLNVHMRKHTGERPYSCPQCGQSFTQTGDRNRHVAKYH